MATLLKYDNGLLIPIQVEKTADMKNENEANKINAFNRVSLSYRSILNLLISLFVIVNFILTAAVVSQLS